MKLLVRHQTVYRYAATAGRVAMRLKLMPVDTPTQTVLDWQVSINDAPLTGFRRNSYGEMETIWIRHDRLDHAVIVAEGLVDTRESHGVVGHLDSRVDTRYFLRDEAHPEDGAMLRGWGDFAVGPMSLFLCERASTRDGGARDVQNIIIAKVAVGV